MEGVGVKKAVYNSTIKTHEAWWPSTHLFHLFQGDGSVTKEGVFFHSRQMNRFSLLKLYPENIVSNTKCTPPFWEKGYLKQEKVHTAAITFIVHKRACMCHSLTRITAPYNIFI